MSHVLSLLPIRLDILLVRGKAAPLRATFAHPDTAVPYDITLDTITLTVRDGYTGAVLFTKSNAPGAHEDPENGVTVLDITAEAPEASRFRSLFSSMPEEMAAFLTENMPPKPQHSSWSFTGRHSTPSSSSRSMRG